MFGFKKECRIDIGSSILEYSNSTDEYFPAECYNNAFKCLLNNIATHRDNRVFIGYVLSTDSVRKVAVRHSWNKIGRDLVDVTMFANDENPISVMNYSYLPIEEYDTESFLDAIGKNNLLPCLPKSKTEYYYISKLKSKGFQVLE